jgi:5-(aminomethyl)-3-furanmethanol phosphate kinase
MTCVVKLGGSLLSQPDWPARFRNWFDQQAADDYCMIVGGGGTIDAMRELDAVHRLPTAAMHWRCIRLLDATFEIAAELLPESTCTATLSELRNRLGDGISGRKRLLLVRVAGYYAESLAASIDIVPPIGWETTTDTLAVFLAKLIHADRVVLLKSCMIAEGLTLADAAKKGIVDSAVCSMANGMQIELRQLT